MTEQAWAFRLPTLPRFTMGPRAYDDIPGVLRPYAGCVLLYGGERALGAGLPALEAALAGAAFSLVVRTHRGECTRASAQDLAREARGMGARAILGMGGGRALDVAKAAAYFAGIPCVTLPTIPATCAAVSAQSVMHDPGQDPKDALLFLGAPPLHAFLHTGVCAASPAMYLRAGIGDSIAKRVESAWKAGCGELTYADRLGLSIAQMGYSTLLDVGEEALRDAENGLDSAAYRLAAQCCVLNTGMVSVLVRDILNGGLAHSLYYAMMGVPAMDNFLHGEIVAWASIPQLLLAGERGEALRLAGFLDSIGIPSTLGAMGLRMDDPALLSLLPGALQEPDMRVTPCPVTPDMTIAAVQAAETLRGGA